MTTRAHAFQRSAQLQTSDIIAEGAAMASRAMETITEQVDEMSLVCATNAEDAFDEHNVLATSKSDISPELQSNLDLAVGVVKQIYMMDIAPNNQPLSPHRTDDGNTRETTMHAVRAQGEFAGTDFFSIAGPESKSAQFNIKLAIAMLLLSRDNELQNNENKVHTGANCGECAALSAYLTARQDDNPSIDFFGMTKAPDADDSVEQPDHAFVVIGRDQATDPEDLTTWNKEAVVLDTYFRLVCPADELNDITSFADAGFALSHVFNVPANITLPQTVVDGDYNAMPIQTPWLD